MIDYYRPSSRTPSRLDKSGVAVYAWIILTPCVQCGALTRQRCKTKSGKVAGFPHTVRLEDASKRRLEAGGGLPACSSCSGQCGWPVTVCKKTRTLRENN